MNYKEKYLKRKRAIDWFEPLSRKINWFPLKINANREHEEEIFHMALSNRLLGNDVIVGGKLIEGRGFPDLYIINTETVIEFLNSEKLEDAIKKVGKYPFTDIRFYDVKNKCFYTKEELELAQRRQEKR